VLKQERYDDTLRRYEQQQDVIRREESFIKKHMGSQRTAEAKGRQKKLAHVERLERPHHDVRKPAIRPPQAARGGELVLEAHGLAAGYGDRPVVRDVELRIGRGERIGVVGANGAGKSTLLKVLAGRMKPLAGELSSGHKAVCGYYDQDTSDLRPDGTPVSEIRRDHPHLTDLEIRSHLARFLFRGEDADAAVSTLSGGERARLMLARLVLERPSWLALDEPTNHLDLASRTALEEMLGEYQGALVCVSHDRAFLDGMCTSILEVAPAGVRRFRGNYTDWRAALEREELEAAERKAAREKAEKAQAAKRAAKASKAAKAKQGSKPARGAAAAARSKPRNPYRFRKLEEAIIALEEERESIQARLALEEVYRDAELVREAQYRLAEIERELEEKNVEWENWV